MTNSSKSLPQDRISLQDVQDVFQMDFILDNKTEGYNDAISSQKDAVATNSVKTDVNDYNAKADELQNKKLAAEVEKLDHYSKRAKLFNDLICGILEQVNKYKIAFFWYIICIFTYGFLLFVTSISIAISGNKLSWAIVFPIIVIISNIFGIKFYKIYKKNKLDKLDKNK